MNEFFIKDDFEKLNYSDWLQITAADLKLEDVEKKLNKKSLEGLTFKALSTDSKEVNLDSFPIERSIFREIRHLNRIHEEVKEAIANGVSNFVIDLKSLPSDLSFLESEAVYYFKLSKNVEDIISKLSVHPRNQQMIFLLDAANIIEQNKCELSDLIHDYAGLFEMHSQVVWFIDGSIIHNAGASMVQELAYLISLGNELLKSNSIHGNQCRIQFHLACDSYLFGNISKLRAFRFIWERLLSEYNLSDLGVEIFATNSLREQTLYDPWVNILRNTTSAFAAILGGANFFSSYAYDEAYMKLTNEKRDSLSERIARNSLHILMQESHLHQIIDPMKGSYSIEDLTCQLIENSWNLFLHFEQSGGIVCNLSEFSEEVALISHERYQEIRKRKVSITGINNFANPEESISSLYNCAQIFEVTKKRFPVRRLANEFEHLRMKYENSEYKYNGYIAMYGDVSKLSARSNFAKNYFEILGIEMLESQGNFLTDKDHIQQMKDANLVVICAADEDYSSIINNVKEQFSDKKLFYAGKIVGHEKDCIYLGQDIYKVLENLVGDYDN